MEIKDTSNKIKIIDEDNLTIEGLVTDEISKMPLKNAILFIPQLNIETNTNINGKYSILIPNKGKNITCQIRCKYEGYYIEERTDIDLSKFQTICINFKLMKKNKELLRPIVGQLHIIPKKKWYQFWK